MKNKEKKLFAKKRNKKKRVKNKNIANRLSGRIVKISDRKYMIDKDGAYRRIVN